MNKNTASSGAKKTYFVCCCLGDGELISELIEALEAEVACEKFKDLKGRMPSLIYGPFFKKRTVLNHNTDIVFSGESYEAVFKGWKVNSLKLEKPANCYYLFFLSRTDGKKQTKPKPIIVTTEELNAK